MPCSNCEGTFEHVESSWDRCGIHAGSGARNQPRHGHNEEYGREAEMSDEYARSQGVDDWMVEAAGKVGEAFYEDTEHEIPDRLDVLLARGSAPHARPKPALEFLGSDEDAG